MASDQGSKHPAPNAADDDYDRKFNKTSNDLNAREQAAAADNGDKKTDLKSREQEVAVTRKKEGKKQKRGIKLRINASLRNSSAFGFILVVIAAGIWYSSILAPNIILVSIKDLYTNDLADATTALGKYTVKMLDYKLGKADCGDPKTIKCKLTTMSRNQVLAFKKHGFTVVGQKLQEDNLDDNNPGNDKPESRWKVTAIVFPRGAGTATDGASFAKLASKDDDIRYLANGVWNPKSSFFMDARFKQVLKDRYDLTKNATTSGTTEKEVDESFDESMQGSDEKVDQSGRGAYSLKTLGSSQGLQGLTQNSVQVAAEPNSYLGVQCGLYTQQKVVYNAAKVAKQVTVARFAMQYLKAADQIKAGLSDEVTANALSGKLAWSDDGGFGGANATDSAVYRHIVMREPVKDIDFGPKYDLDALDVLAALLPTSIQLIETFNETRAIAGAPGSLTTPPGDIGVKEARSYCLEGQKTSSRSNLKPSTCPALTIAAGPLPVKPALSPIAALSTRICPPPPQGQFLMAPTSKLTSTTVVMPYIASLLNAGVAIWANRVANDFNHKTRGVAASSAIFAGTGQILGDMAMSRGMQPANISTLPQYLAQKSADKKNDEAIARAEAKRSPLDAYNKYSFAGSLVRSLSPNQTDGVTLFSSLTSMLSIIPSSLQKTSTSANAIYHLQPDELDVSRLKCTDAEYLSIGINADMACNVRYSMSQKDMDADMNKVLDYMTKPQPDLYKNNIQDLQSRLGQTDAEIDAGNVSRQLGEAQAASNQPLVDKQTGKPTQNSEYQKFLDYCVNRQDPWGRSAMVVKRKDTYTQAEKDKIFNDTTNDDIYTGSGDGNMYAQTQTAAYMSITEGAAADQDWYTGKKCLEDSDELHNFRAYTMGCSVDGSFAGSIDCTERDRAGAYTDDFYTSNDIQYLSWY